MKYYGYKGLLFFLKGLLSLKRGIFRLGRLFVPFFSLLRGFYQKSIGFKLFKFGFFLEKKMGRFKIPKDNRFIEIITSRFLLQIVLLFILVILAIPQSKLYSADVTAVQGQTLLFSLIGPGEQDFDPLEGQLSLILPNTPVKNTETGWESGAVTTQGPEFVNAPNQEPQDIAGISSGGTALIKPSIMTGTNIPTVSSSETASPSLTQRKIATQYEVQSGDVLGSIAAKFGIKTLTLLSANNLSSRSYIRPGDILKIPPGDGVSYTVQRGDTIGRIARQYGIDQSEIITFNNIGGNGANISIGQEIFIPGAEGSSVQSRSNIAIAPSKITETIRKVAAPPPSVEAPAGSGYIWPTKDHRINQYYGFRHTGVDIHGVIGNPNYAVKDGTVIKSQCGWNGGYGCYIIVDHGGGITSLYGHNSKLLVSAGDKVTQGQVIGLLGSTGRSTGPHIHFEIRVGGARVNPLQYIR